MASEGRREGSALTVPTDAFASAPAGAQCSGDDGKTPPERVGIPSGTNVCTEAEGVARSGGGPPRGRLPAHDDIMHASRFPSFVCLGAAFHASLDEWKESDMTVSCRRRSSDLPLSRLRPSTARLCGADRFFPVGQNTEHFSHLGRRAGSRRTTSTDFQGRAPVRAGPDRTDPALLSRARPGGSFDPS